MTFNKGRISPTRKAYGESSLNRTIRWYKRHAKEKGVKYTFTKEEFLEMTQRNCFYCGAPPGNVCTDWKSYGEFIYNGLDRLDSKRGYEKDNIVTCCRRCNRAKDRMSIREFKEWIIKVYSKFVCGDNK